MSDDSSAAPSWLTLSLKLVLGFAWLGASAFASSVLMSESSKAADGTAALFLIGAPLVWCIAATLWAKRLDELHQRVAFLGLADGMRFAITWVGLMIFGVGVLRSLYLGDGAVNVTKMMQSAVMFAAIQPAVVFIVSEVTAFGQLRAYAQRG